MAKRIFVLLFASLAAPLFGEIKLPKIFSDNMVLQREKPVKIWGWASPSARVEVEFAGQKVFAKAGEDGKWATALKPMKASGESRVLSVKENGAGAKKVENVLVGDVWVLGGQSNMAWPLMPTEGGAEAVARAAKAKDIRCFRNPLSAIPKEYGNVPMTHFEKSSTCSTALAQTPQEDYGEQWQWQTSADPKSVELWSAIGYYFAEDMREKLGVPVGILHVALGGSPMIAWVPEKYMGGAKTLEKRFSDFKKKIESWKNGGYEKACADYAALMEKFAKTKKRPKGAGWRAFVPPSKISPQPDSSAAAYNFNAKVAPLDGLSVAGILWYQGESNAGLRAREFADELGVVIKAWRELFGDVPFAQVQLSSYGKNPANWGEAREGQLLGAARNTKVYTAFSIDCGDEMNIHPAKKKPVADRLARAVLAGEYGIGGGGAFSPFAKGAKFGEDCAEVEIQTRGCPIEMRGDPRRFAVYVGGKWQDAKVEVSGSKILFKSADGSKIDGVRYLWGRHLVSEPCVYNAESMPLFPFRFLRGK